MWDGCFAGVLDCTAFFCLIVDEMQWKRIFIGSYDFHYTIFIKRIFVSGWWTGNRQATKVWTTVSDETHILYTRRMGAMLMGSGS